MDGRRIRRFDHLGITVADLDAVTAFFVGLGLEVEGRTFVEGEFIDTVTGIPDARTEIVMLRPPGGGTALELSSFVRPPHEPGSPEAMANELGLRSVAFEVDDLQATVDQLAADGYGLIGGIGQYERIWSMAYVRGPEGIICPAVDRQPRGPPSTSKNRSRRSSTRQAMAPHEGSYSRGSGRAADERHDIHAFVRLVTLLQTFGTCTDCCSPIPS